MATLSELAARLALVPRPRHLEVLGLGPAAESCPVSTSVDASLPAEGFTLTVTEQEGARITHADGAGRRYAETLLDQLRAQTVDGRFVSVRVEDHLPTDEAAGA